MNIQSVKFGALVLAVLGLSACDFYEPTYMTPNKIQVEQSRVDYDISVDEFDAAAAAAIGHKYLNAGEGPVRVTVTYDPRSSANTASQANTHLAEISSALRKNGVQNILSNIMPVHESAENSRLLLTFDAYAAKPPENCTTLSGLHDNDLKNDFDYEMGCSREALIARQIARPKDLLGQGTKTPITDGRRAANTIEGYRSGVPNEPLEGQSASE